MDGPPFALRALSYAWLAEAALLYRVFRTFFFDIARTGGPGTGGLILVAPVALLAVALVPFCLLLALGLHQGAGIGLIKVVSGLGLGVTLFIAAPLALILLITVALFFLDGKPLEGVGLLALTPLFGATLIVLHRAAARAWLEAPHGGSLLKFAAAAAVVAVALIAIPSWARSLRKPAAPVMPLDAAELKPFADAIHADDPAPLSDPRVWRGEFDIEGQNTTGDALRLALVLRKPRAVRALAAQKKSELWVYTRDAMQFGDEEIWRDLAALKAPLTDDNGQAGALEQPGFAAIRWQLAAGADRKKLLSAIEQMGYVKDRPEKIAFLQSDQL